VVAIPAAIGGKDSQSSGTVLPFTGISIANGVAVGRAGNLYVIELISANPRVVKLAAG
jgi:hypothetical protein